jgi:hypothetical protein
LGGETVGCDDLGFDVFLVLDENLGFMGEIATVTARQLSDSLDRAVYFWIDGSEDTSE